MNLPMIAIILEEHSLSKIYGASKTIHLVNSHISNIEQHITIDMTGREINELYKGLDYRLQMDLVGLDIFDETETSIVINQIELLNNASDSEGKLSETLRELIIIFLATIILVTTIVITIGYYENSRQRNAVVSSNLFAFLNIIIDKFTEE